MFVKPWLHSLARWMPAAKLWWLAMIVSLVYGCSHSPNKNTNEYWVGTWSTAPQLVESYNNPPPPGLSNNTLRQVFKVSLGGERIRMRFSNAFSQSPVTLRQVQLAHSAGAGRIDSGSATTLRFDGNKAVTMAPGQALYSDPIDFNVDPGAQLAVTIYFGQTSATVTGHPGSRTTSYIETGNAIGSEDLSGAAKADRWYVVTGMDVLAPAPSAAVVVVGDSISDGRGSGTNKQNRWPDILAERLRENSQTQHIAVLNQGIGGNCVTRKCLGPSAIDRFDRDVLGLSGVQWLIIFEGINDIGTSANDGLAEKIIDGYQGMINKAKEHDIKVFGATLLNFQGSQYDKDDNESVRQQVNQWIRNSGEFDAVIDFEKALADPHEPTKMNPIADDGDHLHTNEVGHRMMGEAVDLGLFE